MHQQNSAHNSVDMTICPLGKGQAPIQYKVSFKIRVSSQSTCCMIQGERIPSSASEYDLLISTNSYETRTSALFHLQSNTSERLKHAVNLSDQLPNTQPSKISNRDVS